MCSKKPSAWRSIAGLLVTFILAVSPFAGAHGQTMPPLIGPPVTHSPQAALTSLFEEVERTFEARRDHDRRGIFALLGHRAEWLIDLSGVPPELRTATGIETALLLYEILRRLPDPPQVAAPDLETVRGNEIVQWTIPGTGLVLVDRTPEEGLPDFRFAPAAIAIAPVAYPLLADTAPLRGAMPFDTVTVFRDGVGPRLTRLIGEGDGLVTPEWSRHHVLGVPAWKLAATLVLHGIAIGLVILLVLALRRSTPAAGSGNRPRRSLALLLSVTIMPLAAGLRYVVVDELRVTGVLLLVLETLWVTAFTTGAILLVFACLLAGANLFIHLARLDDRPSEALAVRLVFRLFALAISAAIMVNALDRLGVPVSGIVASLGVGGIAVALAAQGALQNLFGGVSLLADRPIRIGDFCRFGDYLGTLEDIGFRSCRVRTLDRTVVTVPNTQMASMQIENYTVRDRMLLRTTIGLRLETTPDQLRAVLADLRAMLIAHPMITAEPARARLAGFAESRLEIEIFAYVRAANYNDYTAIREDVMLRVIEIVARNGSALAFPSRTLYVGRDSGVPPELVEKAEAKVAAWRRQGTLPFPAMDEATAGELQDTLAYPPQGSVLRDRAEPRAPDTS